MASIVSTSVYIDKYQYRTLGCSLKSGEGGAVNRDTNLAAWMIGGGRRTIDPSEPEISPMAAPSMPPVALSAA
jgi:hypothetical protein